MCGIFGYFSKTQLSKETVNSIKHSLNHRGPDDVGIYQNNLCTLLHTRLSIVDLSQDGHQPMFNEDGNIIIIFNGEIYNHQELRKDLTNANHIFKSHSDTEVILHGYEEYGDEIIKKLKGMFSFCIYDKVKKSFLIARDRIGQKPLYYFQSEDHFIFASEIEPILITLKSLHIEAKLNISALALYLDRSTIPFPFTSYQNIFKLPPASYLSYHNSQFHPIKYYWEPRYLESILPFEQLTEKIDFLLKNSVQSMLKADVPVALLLSGGVDSSGISAISQIIRNKNDTKSFSVTFQKKDGEDKDVYYSKLIAKKYQIDHKIYEIDSTHISEIPKIIQHFREPLTSSVYQSSFIYQKIKENNFKVILAGDCADEIFSGYEGSKLMQTLGKWQRLPIFIKHLLTNISKISRNYKICNLLNIWQANNENYFNSYLQSFKNNPPTYLTKSTKNTLQNLCFDYQKINTNSFLKAWNYWDLMINCGNTTVISDISGMHHGVEVRTPFLDYDLIDLAYQIPEKYLISEEKNEGFSNKYILKKSLEKYLPKDLLYRKKVGFGSSYTMSQYIRKDWKSLIKNNLLDGYLGELNLLEPRFINKIYHDHMNGKANHDNLIWKLYNLNLLLTI